MVRILLKVLKVIWEKNNFISCLMEAADSPVQNAPSHGQQSIVHSQGITHTVAGLDEERGDGQADQGAGERGEFHVTAHTTP